MSDTGYKMASESRKIQSSSEAPFIKEQLSISKHNVYVKVNRIIGEKDGTWVVYSPSLEVSGYGATKEEAMETFELDMNCLMDSIFEMSIKERQKYLSELGWTKSKYFNKKYSKAYVDEDGMLKDLDLENVSLEAMELA